MRHWWRKEGDKRKAREEVEKMGQDAKEDKDIYVRFT